MLLRYPIQFPLPRLSSSPIPLSSLRGVLHHIPPPVLQDHLIVILVCSPNTANSELAWFIQVCDLNHSAGLRHRRHLQQLKRYLASFAHLHVKRKEVADSFRRHSGPPNGITILLSSLHPEGLMDLRKDDLVCESVSKAGMGLPLLLRLMVGQGLRLCPVS